MQNLLQHIEDNQKAGGEFTISAFTKPVDREINHLEGGGGKVKFKIYPQSQDIKWAANTDVYSGSVWDASEKVSKDKKSELLGVSYTKYPSLQNVNSVQPNLAAIVDDLAHHHNELGISLTGSNFRLEYDENIPYSTKKIINSINSILDQKYGKLVKPEIKKAEIEKYRVKEVQYFEGEFFEDFKEFNTKEEAEEYVESKKYFSGNRLTIEKYSGKQPTQTRENTTSIKSVKSKYNLLDTEYGTLDLNEEELTSAEDYLNSLKTATIILNDSSVNNEYVNANKWFINIEGNYPDGNFNTKKEAEDYLKDKVQKAQNTLNKLKSKPKKEYTSQAEINTKVAALKKGARKFPRSLIRSEVRPINNNYNYNLDFISDELPFQKLSKSSIPNQQYLKTEDSYYEQQSILEQLEEFMAEGIEDFKLENGMPKWLRESNSKLGKILQDLYKFIFKQWDILQQYFRDDFTLKELYRQIENNSLGRDFFGKRRKTFREIFNKRTSDRIADNKEPVVRLKIDKIHPAEIHTVLELINKDLVNHVAANKFRKAGETGSPTLYNYLVNQSSEVVAQRLTDVFNSVKYNLVNQAETYKQMISEETDIEAAEDLRYTYNLINATQELLVPDFFSGEELSIKDESADFMYRLLMHLEKSQGITLEGGKILSHREVEDTQQNSDEVQDYTEDDSSDSEEELSVKEAVDSYERWQLDVLREQSFEKITPKLKRVIGMIPMVSDGQIIKSSAGGNVYYEPEKVFDRLVHDLSSSATIKEMLNKLDKLRSKDDMIDGVLAELLKDDSLALDLWIGIGNKYITEYLMNLSSTASLRVFPSNYKGIVKQIIKQFQDNFTFLNVNPETGKPKAIIGGKEGVSVETLRDLVKRTKDDREQKRKDLPQILKWMGIMVSEKTKAFLSDVLSEEELDVIYSNLSFIVSQIEQNKNPAYFDEATNEGAHNMVKGIAEILKKGDEQIDLKMFTDGKNKLRSAHSVAGYSIKFFHWLRTSIVDQKDPKIRRQAQEAFQEETNYIFYRDAPIVKWILGDKRIGTRYAYMDSRKRNEQQEGREISEMSDAALRVNAYEFWLAGLDKLRKAKEKERRTGVQEERTLYSWSAGDFSTTWYQVIVPDSTVSYFLELPYLENKEDVITELYHVWEQEAERIKYLRELEKEGKKTSDENLNQNGKIFHFFPGFSTNEKDWIKAKSEIREFMNKEFQKYKDTLEKLGLISVRRYEENGEKKVEISPKGEMPKMNLGSFEETLEHYFYNSFLMNTQAITLLSGDPATNSKNKFDDLTYVDWQKRFKAHHASGLYPSFEEDSFNAIYLNDVERPSKTKFVESVKNFLNKKGIPEKLKNSIIKTYEKGNHNLTDAQGYVTLDRWRSIKKAIGEWYPKYDAAYERLENGTPTKEDIVLVSQPLKPHYYGPHLREDIRTNVLLKYSAIVLHKNLTEGTKLDKLRERMENDNVHEAIFESGVKMGKTALLSLDDYISKGHVKDGVSSIQTLKNEYYKEQQKVPEHFLGNVSNQLGVQFRKIIQTNAGRNKVYTKDNPNHKNLIKIFNQIFKTNKESLTGEDLILLIENVQGLNIYKDREKLSRDVADEYALIQKLKKAVLERKLGTQYTDALDILEVMVDKKSGARSIVTRMNLSFPAISRKFEELVNSFYKKVTRQTHSGGSFVNASAIAFAEDLEIKINEDGTWYVEVAIPQNTELYGTNLDTNEIEKIEEGIVYRIPTEEKYSMFPIKVVRWLDPSVGGTIFMPPEVTTIAGLDFDIDKVYSILYNAYKKDGKIIVPRNIETRSGRENILLDAWRVLLQDDDALLHHLENQSIQPLKDIRDSLKGKPGPKSIASINEQLEFLRNNSVGKNLIGIFAVQNAFHSLAEGTPARLDTTNIGIAFEGALAEYLTREGFGSLSRQESYDGKLISKTFGMLISAATDNAKDPVLYDLGVNEFTAPILSFLLHLGVSLNDAIDRINQPDFVNAYKNTNTELSVEEAINTQSGRALYNLTKEFSKAVSALRVDSPQGPTFHDIDKKLENIASAGASPRFSFRGVLPKITYNHEDQVFVIADKNGAPESTLQYMRVLLDEVRLANKYWPYFKDEFLNVKGVLKNYNYSTNTMSVAARRVADVEHMAILHYDLFNIKDPIDLITQFPQKFLEFRASYLESAGEVGAYTLLFKQFSQKPDGSLGLWNKNALDSATQDRIKSQWESAIQSKDPKISQMANDLIKYSFTVYGYQYTYDSFGHLIPLSFYEKDPRFKEFKQRGNYPPELIAFNIMMTSPTKFLPVMSNKFNPSNGKDLEKLDSGKSEKGQPPIYLPGYVKMIPTDPNDKSSPKEPKIYLDKKFVDSGFKNFDIFDPEYLEVFWKNPLLKGRAFDFQFELGELIDVGIMRQTITQDQHADIEQHEDVVPGIETEETPVSKFSQLPNWTGNTKTYAGVGSRETPQEVQDKMTEVAEYLETLGYKLNTGDAPGADAAFRKGAKNKEVFVAKDATDTTREIAKEIHPNPSALKPYPLNLMARNTNQVFGRNLDTPVDFVIMWTKDGKTGYNGRPSGGTGQAAIMASRKGIPVINMANENWREDLKKALKMSSSSALTKTNLFNLNDKELKKGSVVSYKGEKYLFWNENQNGRAQLINTDGTKFSGTPMVDKLEVLGSYPTTMYNNTEYIVTDNNNVYSGATGKLVYTSPDNSSVTQKNRIIEQAKSENNVVEETKSELKTNILVSDLWGFSEPIEEVFPGIAEEKRAQEKAEKDKQIETQLAAMGVRPYNREDILKILHKVYPEATLPKLPEC